MAELTPQQWLKRLSTGHAKELPELKRLNDHYEGTQPLAYLHPELLAELDNRLEQVVINWPELVVDSLDERLDVEGFRLSGQAAADDDLWEIWQANNLDEWSQQGHIDALVMKRAYAIVGTRDDDGEADASAATDLPLITVESPLEVHAEYDPRTRKVAAAYKCWSDEQPDGGKVEHATLYLPQATSWWRKERGEWVAEDADEHGLGVVPVIPIVNRPRLRRPGGRSELASIVPLSNAANKIATDMMVSAEFHSMPRRWALGFGPEDFTDQQGNPVSTWSTVAGRIWASEKSRADGAEVGQFPEADLGNFHATLQQLATLVAALGALPPHFMGMSTDNPASADAIRSSEARLVKRAERRHRAFGGGWEQVMRLADRIATGTWREELRRLETLWRDASTPTVAQSADAATKKFQAGIVPLRQTREDLGYTAEQIALMEQEDERQDERDAMMLKLTPPPAQPGDGEGPEGQTEPEAEEPAARGSAA